MAMEGVECPAAEGAGAGGAEAVCSAGGCVGMREAAGLAGVCVDVLEAAGLAGGSLGMRDAVCPAAGGCVDRAAEPGPGADVRAGALDALGPEACVGAVGDAMERSAGWTSRVTCLCWTAGRDASGAGRVSAMG
ncbi:hypothetical protein AAW14_06925 [Streptomyces hygroscopicus]|uniref:hypothetical protein n=1 Tax=Streptomyces hygroscopicus TaxID=1912 RepID=UPI00223F8ECA|nr:hypothetical protein [Streptomyces hygroscopicus]MCW7941798.1 hypothetical protein [Streptomyces hygroscopicus]